MLTCHRRSETCSVLGCMRFVAKTNTNPIAFELYKRIPGQSDSRGICQTYLNRIICGIGSLSFHVNFIYHFPKRNHPIVLLYN